jgi:20S proteasome alpha/beta subunit
MTAIVGILCRDGVVVGSDSSVTFAAGVQRTIEQPYEKISIIEGRVIVAGTGQVGLGQRFCNIVEASHVKNLFKGNHIEIGKHLCHEAVNDFAFTQATKGQYAALAAFPIADKAHLCEFATADFQPEFKDHKLWYCSMGSGQTITDPFLAFIRHVFWADGLPTVNEAVFAATWALQFAIDVNPGGVNGPVRIAILERVGGKFHARLLDENELAEHHQSIEEAKEGLRSFKTAQSGDAPGTPSPPTLKV